MLDSVAICLFGMCYAEEYNHWIFGKKSVDYRLSLNNYHERIFSKIKNYDVYISTYNHKLRTQLLEDLKPKQSLIYDQFILPGLGVNSLLQRNAMIANFESILKDTNYDWYLFTRFDLAFNFNIDELDYDPNKINILSQLENPTVMCDNFYMVSRSKLNEFFYYLRNRNITSLNRHYIAFFGSPDNIKFVRNEPGKYIRQLTAYRILSNPE